jgi:DNA-directed RNA polymerase
MSIIQYKIIQQSIETSTVIVPCPVPIITLSYGLFELTQLNGYYEMTTCVDLQTPNNIQVLYDSSNIVTVNFTSSNLTLTSKYYGTQILINPNFNVQTPQQELDVIFIIRDFIK